MKKSRFSEEQIVGVLKETSLEDCVFPKAPFAWLYGVLAVNYENCCAPGRMMHYL